MRFRKSILAKIRNFDDLDDFGTLSTQKYHEMVKNAIFSALFCIQKKVFIFLWYFFYFFLFFLYFFNIFCTILRF